MGKQHKQQNGAETKVAAVHSLKAYSPEEVAERISWHPNSVRLACRLGRIHAVRFGKNWRISEATLAALLETGIPMSQHA